MSLRGERIGQTNFRKKNYGTKRGFGFKTREIKKICNFGSKVTFRRSNI